MQQDRNDRASQVRRLIQVSDELRDLSDLVRCSGQQSFAEKADLLERNHELVRRCRQLAAEFTIH